MKRLLALLTVVLLCASSRADAAGYYLVDQPDPAGDVQVLESSGRHPSLAEKKSIDLLNLAVKKRDRSVRFVFTLARVTTSTRFDQVVEIQLAGVGDETWVLDATASPQHPDDATASYSPGLAGRPIVRCLPAVSVKKRTVRVDVPQACLPPEAGVLRAFTSVGDLGAEGVGWSQDSMRVPGRVEVG